MFLTNFLPKDVYVEVQNQAGKHLLADFYRLRDKNKNLSKTDDYRKIKTEYLIFLKNYVSHLLYVVPHLYKCGAIKTETLFELKITNFENINLCLQPRIDLWWPTEPSNQCVIVRRGIVWPSRKGCFKVISNKSIVHFYKYGSKVNFCFVSLDVDCRSENGVMNACSQVRCLQSQSFLPIINPQILNCPNKGDMKRSLEKMERASEFKINRLYTMSKNVRTMKMKNMYKMDNFCLMPAYLPSDSNLQYFRLGLDEIKNEELRKLLLQIYYEIVESFICPKLPLSRLVKWITKVGLGSLVFALHQWRGFVPDIITRTVPVPWLLFRDICRFIQTVFENEKPSTTQFKSEHKEK